MEHVQFIKILLHVLLIGVHTYLLRSIILLGIKINTDHSETVAWMLLYMLASFLILSDMVCYFRNYTTMGLYGTISLIGFMLKNYLKTNQKRLANI